MLFPTGTLMPYGDHETTLMVEMLLLLMLMVRTMR